MLNASTSLGSTHTSALLLTAFIADVYKLYTYTHLEIERIIETDISLLFAYHTLYKYNDNRLCIFIWTKIPTFRLKSMLVHHFGIFARVQNINTTIQNLQYPNVKVCFNATN